MNGDNQTQHEQLRVAERLASIDTSIVHFREDIRRMDGSIVELRQDTRKDYRLLLGVCLTSLFATVGVLAKLLVSL